MLLARSWKSVTLCLLISSTVLAYAQSELEDVEKKHKTTTTSKPITTPSTTTSSTPSPTTPTTAKSTTSSSTEKPTSTTLAPVPTTSTPAPNTSTVAPTTSTTPIPTTPAPFITTTVKPSPAPIGKWNSSCIIIQMAAKFNVTYENKDSKTGSGLFDLPADATVLDADCGVNSPQQIVLSWGPKLSPNTLMLQFEANGTKFFLYNVNLKVNVSEIFSDAKANQSLDLLHIGKNFSTPMNMSYHCTREQILNMTKTLNDFTVAGTVILSSVQFEAFRTGNSTEFSTAKDCDAIDTPDVVPIAVGIALAVLILVVLISYLVARHRRNTRGYTSF